MGGLSFLYPAFLVGALAIAVPIILHLLRRRTETVVDFPAVRLLHKAPVEQQRRRRLRELILLALRIGALILLALAFARPYFSSAGAIGQAPVTLVAVDTSLSLGAPGQFETAQAKAREAIDAAPSGHAVGLLTFADSAAVVVPPTFDKAAVRAAVDSLVPGAGGTRYRTALARAGELAAGRGGRLVVVTDMQQAGWDAGDEGGVPDDLEVVVAAVPPPAGNLAVTAVRREGRDIVAAVHNFGRDDVRTRVRVDIDGKEAGAADLELGASSAAEARIRIDKLSAPSVADRSAPSAADFSAPSASSAADSSAPSASSAADSSAPSAAAVTVDDPTGYQMDNARFMVLDPPEPVPVAVVTADATGLRGGLYVERALGVASRDRTYAVTVVDGRAFSTWSAAQLEAQAAVFLLGTRTIERDGRSAVATYLAGGGHVFVALGPDVDVPSLRDVVGASPDVADKPVVVDDPAATLVTADARHPVFRPFLSPSGALGDIRMEQFRQVEEREGRRVLARLSGGAPALTEETVGEGRLLLFASDLDNQWNRFPLNEAFVPFALETARYLTAGREERQSFVVPDAPVAGATPGIVEIAADGAATGAAGDSEGSRRVAVNVDVRESNPAVTTAEAFAASVTRVAGTALGPAVLEAREREGEQRLWQIGLAVMFIALAGEGLVGRRAN